MKLHILLLLFVTFSNGCNSSANQSVIKIPNPDSVVVSIYGDKLLIGYPTEISIGFNECLKGETVVKTDSCSRYSVGDPDSYSEKGKAYLEGIHPFYTTIWVGKANGKDTLWIISKTIKVRRYPMPSVGFGALENKVRPVPKNALLAQSGLMFPGLGMCGPPYTHQVKSFRLSVLGLDVKSYYSDTYALTPGMKGAISNASSGGIIMADKIVAEDLKDGFESNANTIVHSIIRLSPFEDSQNVLFANWEYSDSSNLTYKKLGVQSLEEIINTHHSINTGQIRMWMGDSLKIYQFEKIYKNGKIIERRKFDQDGTLFYELIKSSNNHWELTVYYPSGQVRIRTTMDDKLDYFGTELYLNNTNKSYDQLDSMSFDSMIKDPEFLVHWIPLYNRELVPVGQFDAYHENGMKSVSGFLSIKNPSSSPAPIKSWHLDRLDTYAKQSVFDGVWVFYNKKGKSIVTRKYDMGQQIQ